MTLLGILQNLFENSFRNLACKFQAARFYESDHSNTSKHEKRLSLCVEY